MPCFLYSQPMVNGMLATRSTLLTHGPICVIVCRAFEGRTQPASHDWVSVILLSAYRMIYVKMFKLLVQAAALVLMLVLTTNATHAQATRTWVPGVGDDANPCSRTAPCKTFAGAISKAAAFGEIDALDDGGFGAVTITKSITIDGGGGQVASVLVAGTNGIVVAAGGADIVIL